jgi:hypothetical protein
MIKGSAFSIRSRPPSSLRAFRWHQGGRPGPSIRRRALHLALGLGAAASPVAVPAGTAPAAEAPATEAPADTTSAVDDPGPRTMRLFPPRLYARGVFYLPKASYSTESGIGAGGQLLYPFRFPGTLASTPASDLMAAGRLTVKGQSSAEAVAQLNLPGDRYYIKTKFSFSNIAERFYGIGPATPSSNEEVYQPQNIDAYVEIFRKLFSSLKAGIRYEFETQKLLKVEPGGILDTQNLRGSNGGQTILGLGLLLDWDTRNARYSPTSGVYCQGYALIFNDDIGSDQSFDNYNLDLRSYLSPIPGHVLASQFFVYASRGRVPYWKYAALGGRGHSRGYRKGRYLDRILVAFQEEYRYPLWWRFGLASFAGLADVGPEYGALQLEHMKPTIGTGIRLRIGSEHGVRARFDVAVGGGTPRFYLDLDEAF